MAWWSLCWFFVILYVVVFHAQGALPPCKVGGFSCSANLYGVGFCIPSLKVMNKITHLTQPNKKTLLVLKFAY